MAVAIIKVVQWGAGAGVVMLAATPRAYSGLAVVAALSPVFVVVALASSLCLGLMGEWKRAVVGLAFIGGLSLLLTPLTD